MLKQLKGVIDAARHAFSSDPSLVRQGLTGIAVTDAPLAARAAEFVISGAHPDVLLDLRARGGDFSKPMGQPGNLSWAFHIASDMSAEAGAAAQASLQARHLLYQRVVNDPPTVALLARLGHVLAAADAGRRVERTGATMPDWLQYLLNDALWAARPNAKTSTFNDAAATRDSALVAERPAWDAPLVAALLAHDGLPRSLVLPVVFERQGIDSWLQDRVYQRLLVPCTLDDYLLAHPGDVADAAGALSTVGRVLLVTRLGASAALLAAFGALVVQLAVGESSTVRAVAARHLAALGPARTITLLAALLGAGTTAERTQAALLLARTQDQGALAALDAALAQEASKPVQQAIRSAISTLRAATGGNDDVLPDPPPLPPAPTEVLGPDALDQLLASHAELVERLRKGAEEEIAANVGASYQANWRQMHYAQCKALDAGKLRLAIAALNGSTERDAVILFANHALNETLAFGGRLEARPDFGLLQVLRWILNSQRWGVWHHPRFQAWLRRQDTDHVDLRQLATLAEACGDKPDGIALTALRTTWSHDPLPPAQLPPARVWPLYAARPELIDIGLGLAPSTIEGGGPLDLGATLAVLATFPSMPARWLPRVLELALGEGKTHRASAQQVLAGRSDIGARVCEALESGKQELRIGAARWLAQLGDKAAVPALYAALAKETRETASAAMLTALEGLGEDMAAHLAPARLLAQARKGLKAKAPAGMAWLNLDGAPACTWQDGSAVEPEIVRWWVILACKLKEPGGNALLERYLGLLAPGSRAALGRWILQGFIAQDTRHPSLDDGIAWAQAEAPQRYQRYQLWAQQSPQYYEAQGRMTPDAVFEQVKREKMSEYLGSAIGEKGLLALAWGTPAAELVGAITTYMRDHYQRRAQVEALIEAASASNEPGVIQFLLSIARRYRTASVQEKARVLVQQIADRNGWTADQLADRTVPTAGLDDTGTLVLQYGSREFTVTLDAAMKPVLRNADGKTVSALPAARQDDPPEAIKEAKQQLANGKKELKQVIDMQTTRLYEAMCAGRAWPVAEWREYLLGHPVVSRLAQRLVWLEEANGAVRAFRPLDDGTLTDVHDDAVVLADGATIRLAHGSLLSADESAAWVAHCKDYKVTPLFAQMTRPRLALADAPVNDIDDRVGWLGDTFTLRGAFTKLGYGRGAAVDGGVFYEYTKAFGSTGLNVVIEFSGSALPEQNLPAALKTLSFRHIDGARNGYGPVALRKVPPILLAEACADYHVVAAACTGFDADWEKKMPW